MGVLERVIKAAWDEFSKPETYVKGDLFEEYVRKYLFPLSHYELVRKTHDYSTNRDDYVYSSMEPDFLFRGKTSQKTFYVEAKFRSDYFNNAIEWCKQYQLARYQKINEMTPVFAAIGIGNRPEHPEELFLVPVSHIRYTHLFKSFLRNYQFLLKNPVPENKLKL